MQLPQRILQGGRQLLLRPVRGHGRHAHHRAAVQTQEQQYFAALALATSYQVTGNRLELFRAYGGIAGSFEADRSR